MLKLYRHSAKGEYLTLAGAGIIIDLIHQAIQEVGADPNDVVLRVKDGGQGAAIDVMYPTPHTFLFDMVHIEGENLLFVLGGGWSKEENAYSLPLANPGLVKELAEIILKRAKTHKKTRVAINSAQCQR